MTINNILFNDGYDETVGFQKTTSPNQKQVQYGVGEVYENNEVRQNKKSKVNENSNISLASTKSTILIDDCCEETQNNLELNKGEYFDPFMYGFTTPVGYKTEEKDKYVTSGDYDSTNNELDLDLKGGGQVKISLSGVTGKDERVTGGTSEITEEKQTISLQIGDETGTKSNVEISLSGMSQTYVTKTEMEDNKLRWEEF